MANVVSGEAVARTSVARAIVPLHVTNHVTYRGCRRLFVKWHRQVMLGRLQHASVVLCARHLFLHSDWDVSVYDTLRRLQLTG